MSVIKSLDQNTVHRICSGQVIINLANAVKELIENSLDAGSKNIEIKLKQYGSESIEVSDDGPGIPKSDFQTITLKHYTSKIQQYEDLETLGTFGFRGEALSSLCALCNLAIVTRESSTVVATRLEYDKTGIIKTQTQCARPIGTTVILEKLFHTLPVRHKEFIKNLKREYHKLMHVIQSYCLISEGVKISCFNIISDKSTKLISTHSKNSLKDNIIEIFSLNAFNTLIKFDQAEPTNEILIEYKLINPGSEIQSETGDNLVEMSQEISKYSEHFKIEGYISSCSHNQGRSAPDRQYFYVNKRPCDHSKITKLVNEIYHQFNRTQYPMFVLSIKMDSHDVDVNVTPDKLQMFFKNESILLAILKASLLKMFNKNYKSVNVNDTSFHNEKSSELMRSFVSKPKSTNALKNIQEDSNEEAKDSGKRYRDEDVFIEQENRPKQAKITDIFDKSENPIVQIHNKKTPEKKSEKRLVTQIDNSIDLTIDQSITIHKESTRLDQTQLDITQTPTSQIKSTLSQTLSSRREKTLNFDLKKLSDNHAKMIYEEIKSKALRDEKEKDIVSNLRFKSKNIDSKDAESELDRCITKEDFLRMRVCGQFNKGFIITQLDSDLFIVDQHAADEIYNFETIQKNGKMQKQKLLQPKYLDLPASSESILIDNLNILEKLGYEVQICQNRKVGNRIMITCVPMSSKSNKLFDFKDIDEILFVLSESDLNAGSIQMSSSENSHFTDLKSSSLRSLYASKACRKSIMIGDSLNITEMKRVITHLNEIDKPWNCPHGRPTMRHLINVDLLKQN
uniref:PMS2 n=1 Tax=Brachionus calyciflorus TaxID=104777 RepID=M4SME8_9BILA|nr:PMS2 [Brachionus calyciflorus]